MLVVGLTGGIATGKSTVSKTLKNTYQLTVIDADLIAREVVCPGKSAYNRIIETFGNDIDNLINDDQSLNREALGRHVFGNKERLHQLNRIVHPAVKKEIGVQILTAYLKVCKVVILDVPLLFESGLYLICGKTITVTCESDVQIERLLARNGELTAEDARKRIDSQMSNDQKCYKADIVLDNNKGLKELDVAIGSVVKEINPGWFFVLVDLFPPFGLLSAFMTVLTRYTLDKFKGDGPRKRD